MFVSSYHLPKEFLMLNVIYQTWERTAYVWCLTRSKRTTLHPGCGPPSALQLSNERSFIATKFSTGAKVDPKITKWSKKFSMHKCQLSQGPLITSWAKCTLQAGNIYIYIILYIYILYILYYIYIRTKFGKPFSLPWFDVHMDSAKSRKIGSRVLFPWCPARGLDSVDIQKATLLIFVVPPGCGPAVPDASHLKPGATNEEQKHLNKKHRNKYIYILSICWKI